MAKQVRSRKIGGRRKVNRDDVANVMGLAEKKRADYLTYGNVKAVNSDGSYQVQLNASSTTARCAQLCDAQKGDRVLVAVMANGRCAAIGRVGGGAGAFLPLAGGTMAGQIKRAVGPTYWYLGRDAAMVRNTNGGYDVYAPILSEKSATGSWEVGTYHSDVLHFSFISDEDYASGMNNRAYACLMPDGTWNRESLLAAYPVGSIFISTAKTSPASLFGGTWRAITGGTYLSFASPSGTATVTQADDTQGGSNTHTLTVAQMPSHNHKYSGWWSGQYSPGGSSVKRMVSYDTDPTPGGDGVTNTGGGQAHQNQPRFKYAYAWIRLS